MPFPRRRNRSVPFRPGKNETLPVVRAGCTLRGVEKMPGIFFKTDFTRENNERNLCALAAVTSGFLGMMNFLNATADIYVIVI